MWEFIEMGWKTNCDRSWEIVHLYFNSFLLFFFYVKVFWDEKRCCSHTLGKRMFFQLKFLNATSTSIEQSSLENLIIFFFGCAFGNCFDTNRFFIRFTLCTAAMWSIDGVTYKKVSRSMKIIKLSIAGMAWKSTLWKSFFSKRINLIQGKQF